MRSVVVVLPIQELAWFECNEAIKKVPASMCAMIPIFLVFGIVKSLVSIQLKESGGVMID